MDSFLDLGYPLIGNFRPQTPSTVAELPVQEVWLLQVCLLKRVTRNHFDLRQNVLLLKGLCLHDMNTTLAAAAPCKIACHWKCGRYQRRQTTPLVSDVSHLGWRTVRIVFLSMTKIPSTVNPIGLPESRLRNTITYRADHTDSYNKMSVLLSTHLPPQLKASKVSTYNWNWLALWSVHRTLQNSAIVTLPLVCKNRNRCCLLNGFIRPNAIKLWRCGVMVLFCQCHDPRLTAVPLLHSNTGQRFTYIPLSPSSIVWYWPWPN